MRAAAWRPILSFSPGGRAMKNLIPIIAILILVPLDVCGRQNVVVPGVFSRQLRGFYHTWSFKGNIEGVRFDKDPTPVTVELVRSYIIDAINQWSRAANQEGEVIRFEEASDYESAGLKILFTHYTGDLGSSAAGYIWIADSGHSKPARLQTTILHEMGHAFIGGGHAGDGVMSELIGNPFSTPTVVCTILGQCDRDWALELYNPHITFRVRNVFGNGSGGGRIVVDSFEVRIPQDTGYVEFRDKRASTFPHTLMAVNRQSVGGFLQQFVGWSGNGEANGLTLPIDTINNASYEAKFKNIYNLLVENDFEGVRNKGFIKMDDTTYALPRAAFEVLQDRAMRLEAPGQAYEYMYYRFAQWSDGSTANPYVQLPTGHSSLTARYNAVRALPPPEVGTSRDVGQPIRVTWLEHPNPKITKYQVWRRVKSQSGKPSSAECVATLARGTTSWKDPDYELTASYTHDLISYGVRAYYSATSAYSEDEWIEVFGKQSTDDLTSVPNTSSHSLPAAYRVRHYPNPIASSTNIIYELPQEAVVSLEIYDLLGRKVKALLQERMPAGNHTLIWNGTNESGNALPAGVYFYRLHAQPVTEGQAGEFIATVKMTLIR